MTRVFVAQHPTEAHMVAELLETGGIQAEVRGEALFSARGEVPVTPSTLPSVWVIDDGQVDDALEFLRNRPTAASSGASAGQAWTCAGCRETVEAQFTVCWNCGAARSGQPRDAV